MYISGPLVFQFDVSRSVQGAHLRSLAVRDAGSHFSSLKISLHTPGTPYMYAFGVLGDKYNFR